MILVLTMCPAGIRLLHWADTNRSAIQALDYVGGKREPPAAEPVKQEGDGEGGAGSSSISSGGDDDRSKLFTFTGVAPPE